MSESSQSLIADLVATGRLTQEEADAILAKTASPEPAVSETPVEPSFSSPVPSSPPPVPAPSYYPPAVPLVPQPAGKPVEAKLPLLPILLITIGTFLAVAAVGSLFALVNPFEGVTAIVAPLFLSFIIFATVGFVLQLKPSSTTRRAASALYAAALPCFFWALSLLLFSAAGGEDAYTYYVGGSLDTSRMTVFIVYSAAALLTFALALLAYWRAPAVITQLTLAYFFGTVLSSVVFIVSYDNPLIAVFVIATVFAIVAAVWYGGIQLGRLREKKIAEVIAAFSLVSAVAFYASLISTNGAWIGVSIIVAAGGILLLWRFLPAVKGGNTSLILAILALLVGIEVVISSIFTGAIAILFGLFLALAVIAAGIIWWVISANKDKAVAAV